MSIRLALLLPAALLSTAAAHAAGTPEQEYQQVRTIALRDAKVRAAYEDADRRLAAKIVQIDPALANYVRARGAGRGEPAATSRAGGSAAPASAPYRRSHVVVKGETLASIARSYRVEVAALKSANRIEDERKLRVGTVLAVPNAR